MRQQLCPRLAGGHVYCWMQRVSGVVQAAASTSHNTICGLSVLCANSAAILLGPLWRQIRCIDGRSKDTMHESEVQIANSGSGVPLCPAPGRK
jgi:hypothetical protein